MEQMENIQLGLVPITDSSIFTEIRRIQFNIQLLHTLKDQYVIELNGIYMTDEDNYLSTFTYDQAIEIENECGILNKDIDVGINIAEDVLPIMVDRLAMLLSELN